MDKKLSIIKCPNCGREYLPSEIFVPKGFFGNPGFIHRDEYGRILNISGTSMDTEESFYCDNCNTALKIKCNITFDTEIDTINDFESDYSTFIESQLKLIDF